MKTNNELKLNIIAAYDAKGKKAEAVELNKEVFTGKYNESLLYQAIKMYRANQRQGNASTKNRSNVAGSGKKPWKQKGTGRARVGSVRSPLWRKGGIVFGPHPRDFSYTLPKKLRKNAFISSLNAKLKSGQIVAIDDIKIDSPKTKIFADILKKLKFSERVLLMVDKIDRNFVLSTRNIRNMTMRKVDEATAYDVLSNKHVILTKSSIEVLNKKVVK